MIPRIFFVIALFFLSTCSKSSVSTSEMPRIVSLDYCADQYVLKLVPREYIAGLSPDATDDYSYMRETAKGLPVIRPRAEDILLARPTLVVRSYGGGAQITSILDRAGIETMQLSYTPDIPSIIDETRRVSTALGQAKAGESLAIDIESRLANLPPERDGIALYVTPGGVTAGQNTLVDNLITTAGYKNAETRQGWVSLPLEQLAYEQPDLFIASFYDTTYAAGAPWSAARHPVMRQTLENTETLRIDGAWTACGAWFLLDAVEAIAGKLP